MSMEIKRIEKPGFPVIGKQGSTEDGEGFIQRLWDEANSGFAQVQPLARLTEDGKLAGIWGAMSDMSLSFAPWEDGFSKGLYLAGIECKDNAQTPEGWTRWDIPGYEYLMAEAGTDTFPKMLAYLEGEGLELVGAVHDFTCPETGKRYMMFPIRSL